MEQSLTTSENIDLVSIIQEVEYGFDEPCSGSISHYDDKKIYLVFDFDDSSIDSVHKTVDRETMTIDE